MHSHNSASGNVCTKFQQLVYANVMKKNRSYNPNTICPGRTGTAWPTALPAVTGAGGVKGEVSTLPAIDSTTYLGPTGPQSQAGSVEPQDDVGPQGLPAPDVATGKHLV